MRYFSLSEFQCSETGDNEINTDFVLQLDELRHICGFPFHINSGYRSPLHSIEAAKPNGPGRHAEGIAADIRVTNGGDRFTLIDNAIQMGFRGIGIDKDYIHIDQRDSTPVMWVY